MLIKNIILLFGILTFDTSQDIVLGSKCSNIDKLDSRFIWLFESFSITWVDSDFSFRFKLMRVVFSSLAKWISALNFKFRT